MTPTLPSSRHTAFVVLALSAILACPLTGQAQSNKKLRVVVTDLALADNLPDGVVRACAKKMPDAVKADERKLEYIDVARTREQLAKKHSDLLECTEGPCLAKTGDALKASLAIRASVTGEAQIYDIEVNYYDLVTGKAAHKETASCEICTATEVGNLFAKTVQLGLRKVDILTRPSKSKATEPTKATPAVTKKADKVSLTIHVMPAEAVIELGDVPLGSGNATSALEPGDYTVRGRLEGFQTQEVPVVVAADSAAKDIYIQLAPEPETIEVAGEGAMEKSIARSATGWALALIGAGGVGTGGYLLWLDGQITCSEGTFNECPSVYETTTPGMAAFGVGMASLTAGVFLIVLDAMADEAPSKPAAKKSAFDIQFDPATGGGVAVFQGQF